MLLRLASSTPGPPNGTIALGFRLRFIDVRTTKEIYSVGPLVQPPVNGGGNPIRFIILDQGTTSSVHAIDRSDFHKIIETHGI